MAAGRPSGHEAPRANEGRSESRLATGVSGLDTVLHGGLLRGGIYLLAGGPGTGKTVLANQIAFGHAATGETALYVTLLTESHGRMLANMSSMRFFDPDLVSRRLAYISGHHALQEAGLQGLHKLLEEEISRRKPTLLVLDGFGLGHRLQGASAGDTRSFLNRLAALLELTGCTALLCALSEVSAVAAEHAIADGVFELALESVGIRAVRTLFIRKFRGSAVVEGSHFLGIGSAGVTIHPRTEAVLAQQARVPSIPGERQSFGIEGLDEMLRGGVFAGSTTALIGAPGSGKTVLGLHFLARGAAEQQRGLYFGFHESPERILAQAEGLGLDLRRARDEGWLDLAWSRPFENMLDPLAGRILEHVRRRDVRRLFIDGLEGLTGAAICPERIPALLAALANELESRSVTTVLSIEGELLGPPLRAFETTPVPIDNTILLRYVEMHSHLYRLVSVLKLAGSDFDASLREFRITPRGAEVSSRFESAEALLSGSARTPSSSPHPPRAGGGTT